METGKTAICHLAPAQVFYYRGAYYAKAEGYGGYKDVFGDLCYSKRVGFSPLTIVDARNLFCNHPLPMRGKKYR